MMYARRLSVGLVFVAAAAVAGAAGAAELNVLSVDALEPALKQLAPAYETASKNKLKISYATADVIEKKIADQEDYDVVIVDKKITNKLRLAGRVPGGLIKTVAKKGPDLVYEVSTTNWTEEPLPARTLIEFLTTPKAVEVYKAKGLDPG